MRKSVLVAAAIAVIVVAVVLAGFGGGSPEQAAKPRTATAEAGGPEISQCMRASAGASDSKRRKIIADCIEGKEMSKKAKECLLAAGITAGGVAVGGVIGGASARAIAGGIVGGGGGACLSKLTG